MSSRPRLERMKVTSIPSLLPGWFDPTLPNFKPPSDWKGTRVRISVPATETEALKIQKTRTELEKRYPGANIHIVPKFETISLDASPIEHTDDASAVTAYLSQLTLPEGVLAEEVSAYLKKFLPHIGIFGVQSLRFGPVIAENVLSFEKVSFDFDQRGLTLVCGTNLDWGSRISNGSGKSNFVSLPFVAMFGRTFKDQTHDAWARQRVSKPARIRQVIFLQDGRKLEVVRGRRPQELRVFLDLKEITMGDPAATQKLIERLTNSPWEILTNAVYIGQQEIGSVFGTEKERKELFNRLLGLDRFIEVQAKIRKEVSRTQRAIDSLELEIRQTTSAISEAEVARQRVSATIPQTTISSSELQQKEKEKKKLEAEVASITKAIASLQPELDANQRKFETLLDESIGAEILIEQLRKQLDETGRVKDRCPLCGAKISVRQFEEYVTSLELQYRSVGDRYEAAETRKTANREHQKDLIARKQDKDAFIRKTIGRMVVLDCEIAAAQSQRATIKKLKDLVKNSTQRIELLTEKKSVHERAQKAVREEYRFLDYCSEIVGRDGLPLYLCKISVPALNAAAVHYSEVFTEGEISIVFDTDQDDITLSVANLHGGEKIKDQSRGEMRIAALITALAFRKVLVPHNILILDEPTDGLDPVNAGAFSRGLQSVVSDFQHVLVISHNDQVLSELEPDRVITITKKDRISVMTESV